MNTSGVHQHEEILTHGLVVVLLLSCVAALLAAHRITNEGFDSPGHTENGLDENNQIPEPEFPRPWPSR